MIEFRLPSLGAEMDEGTLLEWKVKPGDRVKKGDVVAVVDTSKAAIDVEIWDEGVVHELVLGLKETVPVGSVMLRLLEPGETAQTAKRPLRRERAQPAPELPPARAIPIAAPVQPVRAAPPPVPPVKPPRASPAARKRAAQRGVDLGGLRGTGPEGVITLEDVERAASSTASATAPAKDRALEMRAAIAAAMARSKREIPHYYLATDIPLARMGAWLAERNRGRPVTERLLLAVPLLKAVALSLRRYPELNGFFQEGVFVPGTGIHVGVAIALRQGGLIAPAIRNTDRLGLDELMRRLADLVVRARALSLRSSEMSEATVTVTNLGERGVERVQGVIYPPQVALVGFGRVSDRPWVEGGEVIAAPVVTASLSADHRASDGHRGALFLVELARLLQQPEVLDSPAAN